MPAENQRRSRVASASGAKPFSTSSGPGAGSGLSGDQSVRLWSAPVSNSRLEATVSLPGSKSVTNRALLLGALADSPSTLHKPLYSRDSDLMISALRALGVGVDQQPESISISPRPMKGPVQIDVGNAGTVMRFLPTLAALAEGAVDFDGDPRSHERPLKPLILALEQLGVKVEHGGRYSLPMTVHGAGEIVGGQISIDASQSSQFLSSLLLVAPRMKKGLTIKNGGTSIPSMPHIEMTIAMLRERGVKVSRIDDDSWHVEPGMIQGVRTLIERDLSNAAPFMGAAMIAGGSVTIRDWPKSTTQPGNRLPEILTLMGAEISRKKTNNSQAEDLTITDTGVIHGVDIDLHDIGELTPSIAAIALFAQTPSRLRGIGHLRLHETDRLAALENEFNKLGGKVIAHRDSLEINPAPLHGGIFHTYEDHRLATAAAMIGLRVPGIQVVNIDTTSKTFPDFPGLWDLMLKQIQVQP